MFQKHTFWGRGEGGVCSIRKKAVGFTRKKFFLSSTYAELKVRGILRPIVLEDDIDFRVLSPDYFCSCNVRKRYFDHDIELTFIGRKNRLSTI